MLEPTGRGVAPRGTDGGATAPRPLRAWRAERLLAIRDLARLADVAPSTVYLIEAGRATPHPATMRGIAAALGVDAVQVDEFRAAIAARGLPR
jgi:transcriptional regulator with XRE-family HTH domain